MRERGAGFVLRMPEIEMSELKIENCQMEKIVSEFSLGFRDNSLFNDQFAIVNSSWFLIGVGSSGHQNYTSRAARLTDWGSGVLQGS